MRVEDVDGERICFLAGQRAVVGDVVGWVPAKGSGGKLAAVEPRRTALVRRDFHGREQVLAANLEGLLVCAAVQQPPFREGLLDRYLVAAAAAGLEVVLVLTKTDLPVPGEVRQAISLRARYGLRHVQVCAHRAEGLDALVSLMSEAGGPWAVVGHSGVGKTSLIAALLPEIDVGPVGDLSEYWGTGTHTTTSSRLFRLPGGGEIIDSPGIRTFTPGGVDVEEVRRYFPGVDAVRCHYRDCLHRPGEEGCAAPEVVEPELLESYRRLLSDVGTIQEKQRPGR